jgi:hypothetical protein
MDDEPEIARRIREARERRSQTYMGQKQDLDDMGGRFAKVTRSTVTGSGPIAEYPRMPEGSPWAKDECPPEPPIDRSDDGVRLGYRVDGQEDVAAATGDPTADSPPARGGVARSKLRRRF